MLKKTLKWDSKILATVRNAQIHNKIFSLKFRHIKFDKVNLIYTFDYFFYLVSIINGKNINENLFKYYVF